MPARIRTRLWVGAALMLTALNLRAPITSVPPVLDDVRADLGLSLSATGLLTALPLVCFGACGLGAAALARPWGSDVVLVLCMGMVAVGLLIRLAPQVTALFAGTFVLGSGIAIANVLVPAVIKRAYARPGAMMGLYAMMLNVGGAVGAGLTVPMESAFQGSWRAALAVWAVPVLLAAALWAPLAAAAPRRNADVTLSPPRVWLWRNPLAWQVTGLMGFQSTIFYSCLAWIPDILRDTGMSSHTAGLMLAIVMLLGLPTSLGVSILAARTDDQRWLVVAAGGAWVAGLMGLLVAPGTAAVASIVLIGIAQGTSFGLALTVVVLRSADGEVAAALSGMAQSIGYLLAATGPVVIGVVHDLSGGWEVPLAILVAGALALVASGVRATRPGGTVDA